MNLTNQAINGTMDPSGKCHICQGFRPIRYCAVCKHWFCQGCRQEYFQRGLAAVQELIQGTTPGCCGL